MDDMQQAFLYDAFNMYYSLGVRARQQGDEALAERFAAQHPQVRTLTQRGQTLEID